VRRRARPSREHQRPFDGDEIANPEWGLTDEVRRFESVGQHDTSLKDGNAVARAATRSTLSEGASIRRDRHCSKLNFAESLARQQAEWLVSMPWPSPILWYRLMVGTYDTGMDLFIEAAATLDLAGNACEPPEDAALFRSVVERIHRYLGVSRTSTTLGMPQILVTRLRQRTRT
jgi:hypothetical protein